MLLTTRTYILPPPSKSIIDEPNSNKNKYYYFDAGASTWDEGAGGPSMSYFTNLWKRHGIEFDFIQYEQFMSSVPEEFSNRVKFHQQWVSATPSEASYTYPLEDPSPFVPYVINQRTNEDDYVLFKLDVDNPVVEQGIINYLLCSNHNESKEPNRRKLIDELAWEHHVEGNYLLAQPWTGTSSKQSLKDSYMLFLHLRQQGICAHSWV